MFRKSMTVLIVMLLSLTATIPALADAPADGIVVEGVSVPGVALGDTRAQVQAAYGAPYGCTKAYEVDDDGKCSYPVEGFDHLGRIWINFRGPDGGLPSASPDDVVYSVTWSDSIVGWFTEEGGVNTDWARSVRYDPEAVLAVYPNAEITYGWFNNTMTRARDYELGITIEWVYDFYAGFLGVRMIIAAPSEPPSPPAPPEPVTRVTNINLYDNKIKGKRTLWASVWVDDEYWNNAEGATVIVDWTSPDGSTQRFQTDTDSSGLASFEMRNVRAGTHSIEVVDVVYGEHPFDSEYGTLTASINIK